MQHHTILIVEVFTAGPRECGRKDKNVVSVQEPDSARATGTAKSMASETGAALLGGRARLDPGCSSQADQLAQVSSDYESLLLVRSLSC